MIHLWSSPRLGHTRNQCVWTMGLSDSKDLEECSFSLFFFFFFHPFSFFIIDIFFYLLFFYIYSKVELRSFFLHPKWPLVWMELCSEIFTPLPPHKVFCVKLKCAMSGVSLWVCSITKDHQSVYFMQLLCFRTSYVPCSSCS